MKVKLPKFVPIALSLALLGPAQAQQVPAWAKQAIEDLKNDGFMEGYPDGTIHGRRAATRYELAALAFDVWMRLNTHVAERAHPPKTFYTGDLKTEIEAIKTDIRIVQSHDRDIAVLKKLLVELEPELTQLGLNYELLRRQLGDTDKRVSWLESHPLPVRVSGSLDFVGLGGDSGGGNYGLDTSGRPMGIGRGDLSGQSQNSTRDLTLVHEFALTLESSPTASTHWKGTLTTGNLLGAFGQGNTISGQPYGEGAPSTYIQSLGVDWRGPREIRGEVGRVGHTGNPYLLSRPDTTPYFQNARWDGPEWTFDGAKAQLPIGTGFLTGYAGRTGALEGIGGAAVQSLTFGRSEFPWIPGANRPIGLAPGAQKVALLYGADLDVPIWKLALSLNYEYLMSDKSIAGSGDNGRGYGGTIASQEGPLKFTGGYAKTDLLRGGSNMVTRNNQAAWVSARYKMRGTNFGLGYRYIEPLFGGAGNWGRIGMWWNPTDIKGFQADFGTDLARDVRFTAKADWSTGTGLNVNGQTGLDTGDRLSSYTFGIERILGHWTASASFESVDWNLQERNGFGGGKPRECWYGIGLKRVSSHALLSLNWLLSDIDSKGVPGFQVGTAPKARGSIVSAQVSLRF